MSTKHPVMVVTGSSGAGTTSVTRSVQEIFRAGADQRPPWSRAIPSTATTGTG